MIKWLSFGKSLKQLFIISLISCFILLVNSFVKADLSLVDYGTVGNLSSVSSDWNFDYDGNNYYNATNSSYSSSRLWWQSDSFLHFNRRNYSSSSYIKGKITGFFVCPLITGLSNVYLRNIDGCEYYFGFGSDFMNLIQDTDKWAYFYNSNSSNTRSILCGVNSLSNEMICVDYSYYDNEGSGKMSDSDISAVSVRNPNRSSSSSSNNNPIGNSDFEDGYNYTPIDTGDIVFYFENAPQYKFDEDVCYVGLDSSNFDILYNTGNDIAFMRGNDYGNIFDLFAYFFGNTFTIKNVGSFINAWDLNYDEYYNYADRGYNSYYSLSSGFYQVFGDNLENPFIGNSLGLFFMSFNVNKYGSYNTIGEQISTYCYYKLGLDENSDLYNITDNSDSSYWNNAGFFIDNRNRSTVYFSGSDSIVSQSWNGSVMDYFTGDDDLDFANFFGKSFNMFKDKFTLDPNDLGVGFLPSYIFLFLMALIIFRFLSH